MLAGADCGITLLSWVAYQRICSGVSWEESAAPDRAAASKLIFNAATMWTGYAIRSYLSPPIFTAKRRIACDSASRSYHVLRIDPRSRHPLRRIGRFRGESLSRRSEEHTSDLQSLMRISYAVFCLKKKTYKY